jgi:hypothetical protein
MRCSKSSSLYIHTETKSLFVSLHRYILDSEIDVDATVLVHLVEMITREMMFNSRAAASKRSDGFAGLLLPFSWARALAKSHGSSRNMRHTWSLHIFLKALLHLSSELKFGTPGKSTYAILLM